MTMKISGITVYTCNIHVLVIYMLYMYVTYMYTVHLPCLVINDQSDSRFIIFNKLYMYTLWAHLLTPCS